MSKVLSDKKFLELPELKCSNDFMAKEPWSPFEHSFYRVLSSNLEGVKLDGKTLLLAVSGGLDSMVLWELMNKMAPVFEFEIAIAHIHHGPGENSAYRDRALGKVEEKARQRQQKFFKSQSSVVLSSEAEMRDFRKTEIENIREQNDFAYSVWAHHEDDFLETQILRLIRGTGERGIEPMFFQRGFEWRPLLKFSRLQLVDYAEEHKISFVEDPSNLDPKYLRNWLRQHWLPQLEDKCPGALRAISRSLLILAEDADTLPQDIFLDQKLSRIVYMTLTSAQKKQALAQYLRLRGMSQFSHNQIEEIMKRLDNSEIEHTFKVAQMFWSVSRDWIFADPLLLPKPSL